MRASKREELRVRCAFLGPVDPSPEIMTFFGLEVRHQTPIPKQENYCAKGCRRQAVGSKSALGCGLGWQSLALRDERATQLMGMCVSSETKLNLDSFHL